MQVWPMPHTTLSHGLSTHSRPAVPQPDLPPHWPNAGMVVATGRAGVVGVEAPLPARCVNDVGKRGWAGRVRQEMERLFCGACPAGMHYCPASDCSGNRHLAQRLSHALLVASEQWWTQEGGTESHQVKAPPRSALRPMHNTRLRACLHPRSRTRGRTHTWLARPPPLVVAPAVMASDARCAGPSGIRTRTASCAAPRGALATALLVVGNPNCR